MLDNFIIAETFSNIKTHQSVLSDGVHFWSTNAGNSLLMSGLYKYDVAGNLVASNPTATQNIPDRQSDAYQMNGMDLREGKLYVGHMDYPRGSDWPVGDHQSGHLITKSWIVRFDAITLAYETKWLVGDSSVNGANSAAKWVEGCAFHDNGDLFVCFHGDPVIERYSLDENGDLVFVARYTLPSVDNANQTWNAKGFEDITWAGDYAYLNRHAATLDTYLYMFKWTGSGFTFVRKFSNLGAAYHQGVNIQKGTNIMWWCGRTGGGAGGGSELGEIKKVRVVGFDLYNHNSGVSIASTAGVQYADTNGVIVSK